MALADGLQADVRQGQDLARLGGDKRRRVLLAGREGRPTEAVAFGERRQDALVPARLVAQHPYGARVDDVEGIGRVAAPGDDLALGQAQRLHRLVDVPVGGTGQLRKERDAELLELRREEVRPHRDLEGRRGLRRGGVRGEPRGPPEARAKDGAKPGRRHLAGGQAKDEAEGGVLVDVEAGQLAEGAVCRAAGEEVEEVWQRERAEVEGEAAGLLPHAAAQHGIPPQPVVLGRPDGRPQRSAFPGT